MRPLDLPVTFRERAWDSLKYALLCAAFTAAGLWMLTDATVDRLWAWVAVVFFGLGTVALGLKSLRRGTLTIDHDGLTATGAHRPVAVRWEDVEAFVAATQDLPQGLTQSYVGMRLTATGTESQNLGTTTRATNDRLAGCDQVLPSTSAYGQDLDDLVGRLNATLARQRT